MGQKIILDVKESAGNETGGEVEGRLKNLIHKIDSAMDTALSAFDKYGNRVKHVPQYNLDKPFKEFKEIVELLKVSNLPKAKLLEISKQLEDLSKKIDKLLWLISGIFSHPCAYWVRFLKEESEAFLKMAAVS